MSVGELTIESIREDLRGAMFMTHFGIALSEVNGDSAGADSKKQQVANFAIFGVNSKLISVDEGNDWLDVALRGRNVVEVSEKWEGK